jgi:hypothetical protein
MENLIKPHKAQLAWDRISCHARPPISQVRLAQHTAAFWLMHGGQSAQPRRIKPKFANAPPTPITKARPRGNNQFAAAA